MRLLQNSARASHANGHIVSTLVLALATVLSLGACEEVTQIETSGSGGTQASDCSIPTDNLVSGGVPKDGIPALTDPTFVAPGQASYLTDDSRVIGLRVDGEALAIPHNILWYHEIANLNRGDEQLAVTYCPLTGSSLAFDRSTVGGAEFGVSGLLFQNNLTMYDRNSEESLWPQMNREAGCGVRDQTPLTMYPVVEMTWEGWRTLYPDTRVISSETGHRRNYTPAGYPYGNYEEVDNDNLLFDMPIDKRRAPKERLLGIPDAGGIAFPFGELDESGPFRVVSTQTEGRDIVVLWERETRSAMAYYPVANAQSLTFEVRADGIYDVETSSRWRTDGRAVEGELEGARLEPVAEAYVAFWFAWAAFHPETELWRSE